MNWAARLKKDLGLAPWAVGIGSSPGGTAGGVRRTLAVRIGNGGGDCAGDDGGDGVSDGPGDGGGVG